MAEKTFVIKVKIDTDVTSYAELEQLLYDADANDVDLLEEYDD